MSRQPIPSHLPIPIIMAPLHLPSFTPSSSSLADERKKGTFWCVHCAVLLVLALPAVWLPKRACMNWARALCVALVGCKVDRGSNVRVPISIITSEEGGGLAHSFLLLAYTRSKAAYHTHKTAQPLQLLPGQLPNTLKAAQSERKPWSRSQLAHQGTRNEPTSFLFFSSTFLFSAPPIHPPPTETRSSKPRQP